MPASSIATMFSSGAVGRVAGDLARAQLAAEADPPQQVPHRLVLHDVGRRDQRGEDDPGLAAVDHVVVVVAQARPGLDAHRRGVWVGRARPASRRCAGRRRAAGRRRVEPPFGQEIPPRSAAWPDRRPSAAVRAGRRCSPSADAAIRVAGRRCAAGGRGRRRRGRRRGPSASYGEARDAGMSTAALARTLVASTKSSRPQTRPASWQRSTTCSKKRAKTAMPKPLPDPRQAGVVGERLVEGIAQVPAMGEVAGWPSRRACAPSGCPRRT